MKSFLSRELKWIGLAAILVLAATYTLSQRNASPSHPVSSNQTESSTILPTSETLHDASDAQEEMASTVTATSVPAHDVELDIHSALIAFQDALAQGGDELPQADRNQVDRLMANLRLQAETEASAN